MIDEQQQASPEAQAPSEPDGSDPSQAIGYIPEQYPAKEKTYLAAAKAIILRPETADTIKGILSSAQDAPMALAVFIGKIVDRLETKLGPLTDDEHDRVCLVIAGWLTSSLQAMGMPGLDDPSGRQDLIGRILTKLDQLTQGNGEPQQGAPDQEPQQPEQEPPAAPMDQFGGGA
jgi:hypothetical protein